MNAWTTSRLDACCKIVGGSTPSTSVDSYWGGDICWATPKDLSDLDSAPLISDTPRKLTRVGLDSCAASILPPGSVLFSSRAPIGHVAINTVPMATNQGFKSFIPKSEQIDARFLYWWLRANRPYLESLGNGATFKEVSKAIVSRIEIPLPPLASQLRIADVLDRAEALRVKRRAALTQLDTLTQSVFLDLFGDPIANPKGWERKALGAIAAKITDGEHLNPDFSATGMPIVMAGNVMDDAVDLQNAKTVDSSLGDRFRKKCDPQRGDLLLVSRGATIGRLCTIEASRHFCLMGSVILIKPNAALLDAKYLSVLLKHPRMWGLLYRASGSSAQQAIYLQDLKRLTCVVPPLSLQQDFGRRVAAIEKLKTAHRASLAEMNALFDSLQHRAFRGEL